MLGIGDYGDQAVTYNLQINTEIMKRSKLDNHWIPQSIGWLFRPSLRTLSHVHPWSCTRDSNPWPPVSSSKHLTSRPLSLHIMVLVFNFNQVTILHDHLKLYSVGNCLTLDTAELHYLGLPTRTPRITYGEIIEDLLCGESISLLIIILKDLNGIKKYFYSTLYMTFEFRSKA